MLRKYCLFVLLLGLGSVLWAQNGKGEDNLPQGPEKTWRDSGYYFVPTLTVFNVFEITPAGNGIAAASVTFQSTDNSDLSFTGQATFFFRPDMLPASVTVGAGTQGLATLLLPQDLLFCPDEEQEQGMGQDDPYFPLSLVGRYERIGAQWLENPVMISVQLNDFVVN